MITRIVLTATTAVFLATSAMAADTQHWTYEGSEGPAHWGELSHDFATCEAGDEQSPVDIANTVKAEPAKVELHWNPEADWSEVNNGHSIQNNSKDGGYITLAGKEYELLQFHFHAPSEHALDGERLPMEAHFVHRADDGNLAVLAVMVKGGGENDLFQALMDAAPRKGGEEVEFGKADPSKLLPASQHFYRYQGSLTTPPCSETVVWTILKEPVAVSDAAIEEFQEIYAMNARPLQETGRRYILED